MPSHDEQLKAPRDGELSAFSRSSLKVDFNDWGLLSNALTHTSCANETGRASNERLEFLGDSVLGMVTADYLYHLLPDMDEGALSKVKATVVSEESLAEVAEVLGLPDRIMIGKGEAQNGGRHKKAIIADAMEAVIAAIYLDQGLEAARSYILSWMEGQVAKVLEGRNANKDYKSILQAWLQKTKKGKVPEYVLDSVTGPDHMPTFRVKVFLGQRRFGPAEGGNKKQAEQNVARMALVELGLIGRDD